MPFSLSMQQQTVCGLGVGSNHDNCPRGLLEETFISAPVVSAAVAHEVRPLFNLNIRHI
jgi:hypothetical protein